MWKNPPPASRAWGCCCGRRGSSPPSSAPGAITSVAMAFSSFSLVADAIEDLTSSRARKRPGAFDSQHAGQESNLQPAALETAALPIELPASVTRASCPCFVFRQNTGWKPVLLALDLMQRMPAEPRAV